VTAGGLSSSDEATSSLSTDLMRHRWLEILNPILES
jgi:hypothetical protein